MIFYLRLYKTKKVKNRKEKKINPVINNDFE